MKKHYFRPRPSKLCQKYMAREILHHSYKFYSTYTHVPHICTCTYVIKQILKYLYSVQCSLIFPILLFYFILIFKILFHNSVNLFHDPLRVKTHNLKNIDKESIGFSDVYFLQLFLHRMYKFMGEKNQPRE